MPKVTYVGPHPAVRLPWPDGAGEAIVEHGQTIETTSDHAARLLEQPSNWQKPEPSRSKSAKAEKEEVN
jgi:hypothetical protein